MVISMFFLIFLTEACKSEEHVNAESTLDENSLKLPETVDFIFHVKPILSDRCFKCHGPDANKIEGGLQLHTKETAFVALGELKDRFALVPGDIEKSQLLTRINSDDPNLVMPPPASNLSLNNYEKKLLSRWVEQGATWKKHWAFVPPEDQPIPKVADESWPTNPIDHFILKKLEERGLTPSQKIADEKLLRKVSFDLKGLPPSLEDIQAFAEDSSNENYLRIVDSYLASDAFAERMCNEWLDLARYADTHGYQDDLERTMWPWRDWVIHAFKKNMPYDKFVRWQLAGDLIPDATKEQIIATAFNRNHKITQEGGVIPEEYRAEYVTDRTNTFATSFLGLTFECAKCHDHKYDPISQKEYFQLFGYFNNIAEKGLIEKYGAVPEPYINITKKEMEETLTFINNLDEQDTVTLLVMKELEKPRSTHILNRGVYDQPADLVQSDIPSFGYEKGDQKFKDRLGLADWLFKDNHPLTARVAVNRFWQQIFGQGIVTTTYDFGNQGSLPSHPELLDHLAITFQKNTWDIKKIIRYMVNSSTYKQDNKVSPKILEIDPQNKLLARSSRTRLSAEMLRDHALSISGLLVNKIGGPSVKPFQPAGLWKEIAGAGSSNSYQQDEGDKNYRRSMYTFWKRTVPPPNMTLFDAPSRDFCMVKRENTSTPLQALVLMNDPQFLEASKALAYRAFTLSDGSTEEVIQHMFKLATSRVANERELEELVELYEDELKIFRQHPERVQSLLQYGNFETSEIKDLPVLAAFSFVGNTIFNLDETIRKS